MIDEAENLTPKTNAFRRYQRNAFVILDVK